MNKTWIEQLDPIVKVLYKPDGSLDSFLTYNSSYSAYRLYSHSGHRISSFTQAELEKIGELLKSPIEQIDLEELEKF